MIALVDCNNFYVSCERVFNPSLIGKPVIVLSNNDGCIVSRSNEAKAIPIKMGTPVHTMEDDIEAHKVHVFSSNYALYGDMSQRVMNTLATFTPDIEIYSIDEAFLEMNHLPRTTLSDTAIKIKKTVQRHVGIPVGVGIAPTKTLAKVANHVAKKWDGYDGIFVMDSDELRIDILKKFPIEDIWGIGRNHAATLGLHGIKTAYDLIQTSETWIKKKLTVVGLRLHMELRGTPCHFIETHQDPKKAIASTRSFGKNIDDIEVILESISNHTARVAQKLRAQNSFTSLLQVFATTNRFRPDFPQHKAACMVAFQVPTNNSMTMIEAAKNAFRRVAKAGMAYKKSGVMALSIVPDATRQTSLFDTYEEKDHHQSNKVMEAMDALNYRFGKNTVKVAAMGYSKEWGMRQQHLSRHFTTDWDELIQVHC